MATDEAPPETLTNRQKNRRAMLDILPKDGRCAEIGVWTGGFSWEILNITRPKELVLIDPWDLLSQQSSEKWTHGRHWDSKFMGDMYHDVESQFSVKENVRIRKGFSADILASYPDNYFDWVYIDGNHQYDFVKKDFEISFQKVMPGGIIAGDDFFWSRDGGPRVKDAVFDAMKICGIDKRRCFTRMGQQYLVKVEK